MKPTIHSLQNQQIKQLVKLRDASTRRECRMFVIDGDQEIQRALMGNFVIDCVYYPEEDARSIIQFEGRLLQNQLQPVSSAVMRKIAYGDRENGLVAVAQSPKLELGSLRFCSEPMILVLDRIEKPGNLGACLRTAAATGVAGVILTNPICDVFNPNAIRASRGCLFSVPLAIASSGEVVQLCNRLAIPLYTARVDGVEEFWKAEFRQGAAIVFGNEAHGLQVEWNSTECRSITIPMHDTTDSLNVSITAAVTLYEAMRQRRPNQLQNGPYTGKAKV